ncbi:MAG: SPOR domain-containing protein [Proteobacteria bacterium]|nr:SPOR domain-containing protein [Pseudomonadota bacterium]MBS0572331.1 SPOR domain-containing protein [Pseudomonadota bacterium]
MQAGVLRRAAGVAVLSVAAAAAWAEAPPAGFAGRQFTDARGCQHQRATLSGRVLWLPLLGPDGQPVCGQGGKADGAAPEAALKPVAPASAQARPVPPGARWVQAGAFADRANALRVWKALKAQGFSAGLVPVKGGSLTAVVVGPFERPADLAAAAARLRKAGFPAAFAR